MVMRRIIELEAQLKDLEEEQAAAAKDIGERRKESRRSAARWTWKCCGRN